jgi:23S rRNA (uracil1939-C5)-methyltransferase
VEGKVVFVEGGYPGDQVTARIVQEKKRFILAHVSKIDDPSEHRVEASCPHVTLCGGCPWMGLSYDQQLFWKREMIQEAIKRIGGAEVTVDPVIAGKIQNGYRHRVRLAVAAGNPPRLGYRSRGARDVIGIDQCAVADEKINTVIAQINAWFAADPDVARPIYQIAIECDTKTTRLTIHTKRNAPAPKPSAIVTAIAGVAGVAVMGEEGEITVAGDTNLAIDTAGQITLSTGPGAFAQSNGGMNRRLAELVMEQIPVTPGVKILDLFCGAGNYALPLAAAGATVVGGDRSQAAIDAAIASASNNAIGGATFVVADAIEFAALLAKSNEIFDVAIVNPPRTGAPGIASSFATLVKKKIVYVSCDPATFARDTAALIESGFTLNRITPVDLFPHTPHVELVATFDRQQ